MNMDKVYFNFVDTAWGGLGMAWHRQGLVFLTNLGGTKTHLDQWLAHKFPGKPYQLTTAPFQELIQQVEQYLAGELLEFNLPLHLIGTEFQVIVWRALQAIPYGQTRAYSEIAQMINRPKAVRAVGGANHHNPLPLVVPCHRVIGKNGDLVGFGGGLPLKRRLLEHELKHVANNQGSGSGEREEVER